jgi:hypothetical protein
VVASDGGSSNLVHFTYTAGGLTYVPPSLPLPAPNARGIALSGSNSKFAISFLGGQVAIAHIDSAYNMSLSAVASLPTTIATSPYWCQCQGDVIALGGADGLYLLDGQLYKIATYLAEPAVAGGPSVAIRKTPGTDGSGNWFFGADDGTHGYVYEVRQDAGATTMSLTAKYGDLGGPIGISTVVGVCHSGQTVCIYLGLQNNQPSIVPLDSRQAVLNACISTSASSSAPCSGANPRLWVRVEVGSAVSAQTVRVRGWSYYSA